MKIEKLIEELTKIRDKHGNIETRVRTLSHMWSPEPTVKESSRAGVSITYVLLNP